MITIGEQYRCCGQLVVVRAIHHRGEGFEPNFMVEGPEGSHFYASARTLMPLGDESKQVDTKLSFSSLCGRAAMLKIKR